MASTTALSVPLFPDEGIGLTTQLSTSEWEKIENLEKEQEELRQKLHAKFPFPPELEDAFSCRTTDGLQRLVDSWSKTAGSSRLAFDKKHEKGWGRWSQKYESISVGVCDFLRDIRPLLDAVNDVGGPYTGTAIGTITAVFFLSGSKYTLEEEIAQALEGIKDRLPGFRMYAEIYSKNHGLEVDLRKKIVQAYIAFMELCVAITRYYLQTGFQRWTTATFTPSKLRDLSDDANNAVLMVRGKCEELLNWNMAQARRDIAKTLENNERLLQDNKRLEKKIDDLRQSRTNDLILRIKSGLRLATWTLESHQEAFSKLKTLMSYAMADEEYRYEQMALGRIERFRKTNTFLSWDAEGESRLLLLVGENHDSLIYESRNCWVSPFALNLIDRLTPSHSAHDALPPTPPPSDIATCPATGAVCASFVFHSRSIRESPITMYDVVSVIALQLICTCREMLCEKQETLDEVLAAFTEAREKMNSSGYEDECALINTARDLLISVLDLFDETDTVYIVLDRIDRCREVDHYDFLELLGDIVGRSCNGEQKACAVKVLAVANREGWEGECESIRKRHKGMVEEKILKQGLLYEF
ncbi:hypothetical protein MKZ38_001396 [Zalerion maritima]|uniref:DUF7708 domain-containing protein n=1 Tax=Zalerion maritima TaxID=339359 RepID=A0AAD5RQ95_9PEZI|nr:hypothetical protein MKZ38_001396 [Zalerion maritima]